METPVEIPGKVWRDRVYTGKKREQGSTFHYDVYLTPTALEAKAAGKKLALYFLVEHTTDIMAPILTALMEQGIMPPGLTILIGYGVVYPTLPVECEPIGMRTKELDEVSGDYTSFLIDEIIPAAVRCAKVELDPSPDMHFITGGSSGGTLAFNAVWFRNDYFHRAFLSSPTFASERGGEEILTLVRKTETKPIKMYLTNGTEEPAGIDGSSLYAALNAADTFAYAGYDFRYEQFIGEGHCSRRQDAALWARLSTFLWANWRTDPAVRPLFNQVNLTHFLEPGSEWKPCKFNMPSHNEVKTKQGTYTFADGCIYLEKDGKRKCVATDLGDIRSIQLADNQWRLYVASHDRRYLYAMSIMPNGSLKQRCKLAPLHLPHDCHYLGASDLAISPLGKPLAATELGIQGIAPSGMVHLIIPMPDDLPADAVAVKGNMLYASCGGKVYRRAIRTKPVRGLPCGARTHIIP